MAQPLVLGGRYRLIRVIGEGGMGRVWLGFDELIERDVAVKQLRGFAPDAAFVERAIREARAAGRLQHPNVVRVYDLVMVDGLPNVIMEYVSGTSLEALAAASPIDVDRLARFGSQVAAALASAHRAGIIHRDVKPANVLIDDAGDAKLADFGIARLESQPGLTNTGIMIGTLAYMSPEVANGAPITSAADIWSLGATLYSASTGRMLFEASNALAVFSKLMTEPLPAIESGSGAFDDLLRRMLDRDPVARPSAAAAAELLRTIAAGAANTTSRTSDPTGTTPTAGLADAGPRPARRTAADATVADAPSTFPTPWNDGGTERQPRPVQRARRTRILIAVAVVTSIVAAIAVVILAGGSGQPSRSAGNSSAGSGSSTPGPRRTRSTTAPLAGLLPDTIRETGIVRVASDYPYPPYEFMTGNSLTGFEYDLTQAMAQRLGVTFKWVRQPFTEIIPGVMSGNFDVGMSGITDTRAREEAVDFVDYGFTREAILVKKGDPRGIAGRGSLCGLRVLVVFATPQAEELQKESDECIQGGKPAVTMLGRDPSTASAVSAIISGKADATIEDAATATYLAKTIDDGSALDAVPFSDKANSRDPLGIAVSKSDSQLSAALKQTLTALIEDGTYANILRKYGIESLGATSITINAATS